MIRSSMLLCLLVTACTGNGQATCQDPRSPVDVIDLTVPPYLQARRGAVRVRFESRDFTTIPFAMATDDQKCDSLVTPDRERLERTWTAAGSEHPDEAGEYTLYTATLDQMLEDTLYDWKAHTTPDPTHSWTGKVSLPPAPGAGAVVAFTGALRPPVQADLASRMLADDPDMVLLGGDLQANDTTDSTWSRLMHDLSPLLASRLLQTVAGDKDDEDGGEMDELYQHWFGGQGRAGGGELYYSVDIAGIRFVVMDTSDPLLARDTSKQMKWVRTELADITPQSPLTGGVIVLHNGPWSLADTRPLYEVRDAIAQIAADAEVKLVLSSGGHAYERFEVEGVQYVVDGGGGATLSTFEKRTETHPEDLPFQAAASSSYGFTLLTIGEDGGLHLVRKDLQGEIVDEVDVFVVEDEE